MSKYNFLAIMALLLTGCTYSGQFNCPDAKGARCVMLSEIDKQVNSGEIEKIYQVKKKNCKLGTCDDEEKPPLASQQIIKARLTEETEGQPVIYQQGEDLYVK